ncbi:urea ABC transporter ATP-binding protein UrtD [Rhizobacter sp. Root404]|uniref:urea ABC transporter ATP-binding protein UrtD n=1 Tax=Rhizobacter sp. Root404 TaxID=1736528 RepID=UPI000701112E|nr:urea ABC transporter ATP-binding protein UrtD [Rhizobacter sp. Root404]KQW38186.1 urea ABC transporter ATP-binding protein UrtD [Rhizobacter sp. Root404]
MTPELMAAGARAKAIHEGRPVPTSTESGGRETSYGRIATGELDVTHGAILYLDDITVSFDGFKALNALSLSISAGEMRCIIGPNGAGKTTMMDVITGKTRPDLGKAFFGSTIDLLRLRENEIASIGIGRKFQKPTVFEYLTVFENLELALKADRGVRASMFFRLNGEQLDRIGAMLTLIHLKDSAQRVAGLLSHGQKQWLEIGMLLMQDPKLLLLDEPVAGMTDEETERTAELFLSLEGSHSLVVVEHDMKFIGELTQNGRNGKKVTVLHEGSVLAEGLLSEVQANEKVVEVYLGR